MSSVNTTTLELTYYCNNTLILMLLCWLKTYCKFTCTFKLHIITHPIIHNTNSNQQQRNKYTRNHNRIWNQNHNNRYIKPNNRDCNNNISTIHITNTNCSREYYQRIQGTSTTHKIMNKPTRNGHPLFKIVNNALVDLQTPSTIDRINSVEWWKVWRMMNLKVQRRQILWSNLITSPELDEWTEENKNISSR